MSDRAFEPGEVALCLPLDAEERLVADAARYGQRVVARCSGAGELTAKLGSLRPRLVVVAAQPQYLDAELLARCDSIGARLAVAADGPEETRYARSLGLIDTIPDPLEWERVVGVRDVFDEAPEARPATAAPPSARADVIAVWGPAGAPGRTSLSLAIAAELALHGSAVALGDADTHAAAIAPSLGLLDESPGFAAACRLAGTGSLSRDEFERVAEWVPLSRGGMFVLTGLGRPARWPELTAERVTDTIAAARGWVSSLVLDTGAAIEQDEELSSDLAAPRRNAATLASLREADHVVLVGAADPIGLARLLRAHVELLETAAPARVTVVVNKVRPGSIGINPGAQIRQTLERFGGIEDAVLIPWDPAAFDAALVAGRPLGEAAPRSPARAALRRLVESRLLGDIPVPRRRRILAARR